MVGDGSSPHVNARVGEAVDELTHTSQGVRDEVAGVVARSAREVERFATASSTRSLEATAGAGSPNWMLYNSA
jgi:hypothetical protein